IGGKNADIWRALGNGPSIGGRELGAVIDNDANDGEAPPEAGVKTPPEQAHEETTGTAAALLTDRFCLAATRLLWSLGRLAAAIATATGRSRAAFAIDGKRHGMAHGRLDPLALCCRARLWLALAGGGASYAVIGRNAEIHQATCRRDVFSASTLFARRG